MKNTSQTKEEKVFTVNQIGSILERMDDSIKILAEAQSGTNVRLDGIDNRLEKVENRLEKVEVRLGGVEGRLELVETKIDRLQDDMVEVKFELKRKVDAEQFEKLEKRVVKLEKHSYSQ
ncbi:MAG: hypothetical protein US57_C0011G0082 [Candidatus Moranbacteria bacterium GW2011_GWC2_37_73]|nr:MAG: coiled-coil [Parcubacteria group bacterium GW2011_GWC1_36_108]KKQ00490.1 MAG: hypothetical protein US09_C0011G0048 [Candidatus Moranbacteria bacterium GW2011_GWD1_36_198]KKQ01722.1 MAG: hypothetical protein US10_C0009G0041 [Candidatus Moranbacteria bacterium GW2011_GWD2_36_198]KKQ39594.1 MAG: hypothetical protein US57_C0011G0082 [Candidatus Moranbacteria bacterium GW2011_GWC2_37_73]HAR99975.1 hypothetical protein [Candidatus Moranbacteria bacterium]